MVGLGGIFQKIRPNVRFYGTKKHHFFRFDVFQERNNYIATQRYTFIVRFHKISAFEPYVDITNQVKLSCLK